MQAILNLLAKFASCRLSLQPKAKLSTASIHQLTKPSFMFNQANFIAFNHDGKIPLWSTTQLFVFCEIRKLDQRARFVGIRANNDFPLW